MYFSLARQAEFTSAALTSLAAVSSASLSAVDVFIIPDFLNIRPTADSLAAALADSGVRIVEVGHAERRRLFGEDDAECRVQVDAVMAGLPSEDAEVVLAYEPVWAIGAAQPAGEEHVLAVVAGIRDLESVKGRRGLTRVVYGGSAGPGLYDKLKSGLDGLFLGRFGHDPQQFAKTVQEVAEA
uniref:Triosephosphate isomerase n=1 Tax=Bionectria ochroleuca TaxID=29856 RepID=A0A0B7KPX2_BIOOC